MWKKIWKKYGTMIAAAVFLTVAGFCYGFAEWREDTILLPGPEKIVLDVETQVAEGQEESEYAAAEARTEENENPVCYVHICGEVKEPGVYQVPEGSRIFEVVEAAGGMTDEAADFSLNLAEPISDGMQIVILSREEAQEMREAEAALASGIVNINKASKEQLMTLPGIGESRAEEIIRYREKVGGFQTIEEIMKVSGIKDAAFQKIKDSITV